MALLSYDSSSTTLLGGFSYRHGDALQIGLDLVWNDADGSLAPFDFVVTPDYGLDAKPNQSYDFGDAYLNSDQNVSRFEAALRASYSFDGGLGLWGEARWAEVEDDTPYLQDYTGSVSLYAAGIGYTF